MSPRGFQLGSSSQTVVSAEEERKEGEEFDGLFKKEIGHLILLVLLLLWQL